VWCSFVSFSRVPLYTPSFYAVQVYSGALGTKGGPRTDGNGQVLDVDGRPIQGLYAAGNAMASVMGMTYGGAGGTLGPAIVFGYLAGRHAAQAARS
jgi:succinate dehydrogenase/fumarate reductase flavoprotein subunit